MFDEGRFSLHAFISLVFYIDFDCIHSIFYRNDESSSDGEKAQDVSFRLLKHLGWREELLVYREHVVARNAAGNSGTD